jgi:transposase-like protein
MAQHFLLSAAAKTLSVVSVLGMTDMEAEAQFKNIRWAATGGQPVCPECACNRVYSCRRASGRLRFRCAGCQVDFSITSGTLFASHKLSLKIYLAAIAIFCNEVKGKSSLALSRDLGTEHKTAWVLCQKLREAMASEVKNRTIGGFGRIAEIDGGYFGGYIKPSNNLRNRRDRRLARNQNGKRRCVVVIRERDGLTLPYVFRTESEALDYIRERVEPGTMIMADESHAWNDLGARYELLRINHQEAYSVGGACTNGAEGFFSRMRRCEIGHHHHIAGIYLLRYAQEMAWRDDNRRMDNGNQIISVASLALSNKPSQEFAGYWQRAMV